MMISTNAISYTSFLKTCYFIAIRDLRVVGEKDQEDRKLDECLSVDGYEADEDSSDLLQECVKSALMRSDAG